MRHPTAHFISFFLRCAAQDDLTQAQKLHAAALSELEAGRRRELALASEREGWAEERVELEAEIKRAGKAGSGEGKKWEKERKGLEVSSYLPLAVL
jgi:hypothetical protein